MTQATTTVDSTSRTLISVPVGNNKDRYGFFTYEMSVQGTMGTTNTFQVSYDGGTTWEAVTGDDNLDTLVAGILTISFRTQKYSCLSTGSPNYTVKLVGKQ